MKHTVSKSKRRYIDEKNGIDLDLSYINDRIIAMGFPSDGRESIYRNPMSEVQKLLELKHKDHYKVYNLCSERAYDHKKFHYRVERYPFDDHNCPNFDDIWAFCEDVKTWLDASPENVACIHCKAGKGRTGLMICCWLLFCRDWDTADNAMKFYALARTLNQKGVTIPSQVRYIRYFEERVRCGPVEPTNVVLTHIIFYGLPKHVQELKLNITKGPTQAHIFSLKKKVKDLVKDKKKKNKGKKGVPVDTYGEQDSGKVVLELDVAFAGDIRFEFEKLLHFWLNTGFVQSRTILYKSEMDKAHKDSKHKLYPPDFRVELRFKAEGGILEERAKRTGVHSPAPSLAMAHQAPASAPALHKKSPSQQTAFRVLLQNYPSLRNI